MSVLTESMARLRVEILALRHGRKVLRGELADATRTRRVRVSELRGAFERDLGGARRVWHGLASSEPRPAPPPAADAVRPSRRRKRHLTR